MLRLLRLRVNHGEHVSEAQTRLIGQLVRHFQLIGCHGVDFPGYLSRVLVAGLTQGIASGVLVPVSTDLSAVLVRGCL